ncbi:MAG: chorismate synthase [Ruminococcaceae bacterium]|nr:chorismate synthase [Oscillospiraceae bacterium]
MSSEFGKCIKVSIFGQSHGKAIGVVVDGLPSGERVDMEELNAFLSRRKPGKNKLSTARRENDIPVFLSGIADDTTCGSPICAIIENSDARSKDYAALADKPRPSHADYTAWVKWNGTADMRGGGHFSGRLTAPLCIAGGIAKQILACRGIHVGAHLYRVAGINDDAYPMIPGKEVFDAVSSKEFPVISDEKGALMQQKIAEASADGDSVGGIIECAVIGLPAGLGSPMFDGMENRLAQVVFGIPAVKGIEFGSGFESADLRGSENNDPFTVDDSGKIVTVTNNCGGILGGITNGMPLTFKAAIKPTPSISKIQNTVSLSQKADAQLAIEGRHDPCIAHRAVPVMEAAAALAVLDILMEEGKLK